MKKIEDKISQKIKNIKIGDSLKSGDIIAKVVSVDHGNSMVTVEGQPEISMLHLQDLIIDRKVIELIIG